MERGHATTENHITDRDGAKIIDKETSERTQQVKEAIWIRKTKTTMNRDKRNYEATHSFMQRPVHPSFGRVNTVVDG